VVRFHPPEEVLAAHAAHPFDLSKTESPAYFGRAIRAVASDPHISTRSGELVYAGDLAKQYGFTDTDGSQPPPLRVQD